MNTFEQIDKYRFRLSKVQWDENQHFSAMCIGLKPDGQYSYICDIRYVWPEAFYSFLKYAFGDLFSQRRTQYRASVEKTVHHMYRQWFQRLKDHYKELITYNETVGKDLRKHQSAALWRMLPNQMNFLSFDMGLGKTLTSATLSKLLDINRTAVIAPAGVKWNWFHDLVDDWGFDSNTFSILDSNKRKMRECFIERFVIMNYECIDKHFEYLTGDRRDPIGHIIIDECHLIKNHRTKRYKNVERLVRAYPKARVTLLSGTPVTNRVNDMFAYFKLSNHLLGRNQSEFMRRYIERTNGYRGKIVGAKNLDELRVRYSNFMIRKRTEECIDLPDLTIRKLYMDESEITKEYKDAVKDMYEAQMAQKANNISDVENAVTNNVHTLNRILATTKAKLLIEEIDKLIEQGKKVIIFSGYTAPLAVLEDHYGFNCVRIDGKVNPHERSMRIQKFNNDPKCHVFLGNNVAAGMGTNLVSSHWVFLLNFPFTPDNIEQPQKRAHRMGQKENVFVNYTIVKGSIDEHIYNIIIDKSSDINELLDKDKPGVINYNKIGNVANTVYNQIIKKYAQDHNLPQPVAQFQEA